VPYHREWLGVTPFLDTGLQHHRGAPEGAPIEEQPLECVHRVGMVMPQPTGGGVVPTIVLDEAGRLRPSVATVDTQGFRLQARGEADQVRRVVRNVMENAVHHARTAVTVELDASAFAVLLLADDGPGIPEDARRRVVERFTRLDGARAATTGGTGLGLPIAREIVERHGGTISVTGEPTAGARFIVTPPTVEPPPRPPLGPLSATPVRPGHAGPVNNEPIP
jgi:signal transduction histidine kinase